MLARGYDGLKYDLVVKDRREYLEEGGRRKKDRKNIPPVPLEVEAMFAVWVVGFPRGRLLVAGSISSGGCLSRSSLSGGARRV